MKDLGLLTFIVLLTVPIRRFAAVAAGKGICFLATQIGAADGLFIALAWTYVALRAAHSFIQLTYNNVLHRLTFFALSNSAVMSMRGLVYRPRLVAR